MDFVIPFGKDDSLEHLAATDRHGMPLTHYPAYPPVAYDRSLPYMFLNAPIFNCLKLLCRFLRHFSGCVIVCATKNNPHSFPDDAVRHP